MTKIAIDAGHGSTTAGKRTPDGYREHWINVKTANYFDIALKRCGFETVKIAWDDTNSTDDTDIPLTTRQNTIKSNKCNASVSWHANAYGDGKSYNSGEGIETLIHNSSAKVGDSKSLADKIQKNLIKGTQQKNRGVKSASLAMCNCSAMGTKASVLIEIGFMTNLYESSLIKQDSFCLECAEEAAQGICEYYGVPYIKPNGSVVTNTPSTTPISKPKNTLSFLYKGLDYSPVFNPDYYASHQPDVKNALGTNPTTLFSHFCTYGMVEGRQAISTFYVVAYREKNDDLRKAFDSVKGKLDKKDYPKYFEHYLTYGYKEKDRKTT